MINAGARLEKAKVLLEVVDGCVGCVVSREVGLQMAHFQLYIWA